MTMRIRLVVGFALTALAAQTGGCSSSTNPYPDVGSFCTAYAKAICQIATSCSFDPSGCQTFQSAQCNANAQTAVASGRLYNSGAAKPCLDAVNSAYGNSPPALSASAIDSYTKTCNKVFGGTSAHHATCTVDSDCTQSGDVCAAAPGSSAKSCVTPTPKQLGDACADPGDQCPAGAYCQPQTGTSVCAAAAANGASCSASTPCSTGLQCAGGTCSPQSHIGDACSTSTDCSQAGDNGAGGSELFCDTYTDSVVPTPRCAKQLGFATGSVDCIGVEGQGTSGTGSSSGSGSGSGSSSGSSSGGDAGGSSGGDAGGASDSAAGG
jgi:hypothetical protein